ncbi:MAG TPA: hypothetical protein VHM90_20765 [Phycisphaerae bacterium]|jgi:hypothetical protein|nr:hypothetical protein [Phycisphaerae bacterium]
MSRIRLAVLVILASAASAARADIGIDFVGGSAPGNRDYKGGGGVQTMTASETAGVVPQAHWNTAGSANEADRLKNNVGSISGILVDDTGKVLADAAISWKANNCSSTILTDAPGNNRMMRGYLDSADPANPLRSSTTSVTLTVPESYAKAGYDLIVYFDANSSAGSTDRVGRYRIFKGATATGGAVAQAFGKTVFNSDFGGKFVESKGGSAQQATAGNYVVFHQLRETTISLDATGVAGDVQRAPINAIQIVSGPRHDAVVQSTGSSDAPAVSNLTDPGSTTHGTLPEVPAPSNTMTVVDRGGTVTIVPETPPVLDRPVTTVTSTQLRQQMTRINSPGTPTPRPAPKSNSNALTPTGPMPLPTPR